MFKLIIRQHLLSCAAFMHRYAEPQIELNEVSSDRCHIHSETLRPEPEPEADSSDRKWQHYICVLLDCHQPVLDGFDQHFQALVCFPLTSSVGKSHQHRKINIWECQESNPGPLYEKQECCPCAMPQVAPLFTWPLNPSSTIAELFIMSFRTRRTSCATSAPSPSSTPRPCRLTRRSTPRSGRSSAKNAQESSSLLLNSGFIW